MAESITVGVVPVGKDSGWRVRGSSSCSLVGERSTVGDTVIVTVIVADISPVSSVEVIALVLVVGVVRTTGESVAGGGVLLGVGCGVAVLVGVGEITIWMTFCPIALNPCGSNQ